MGKEERERRGGFGFESLDGFVGLLEVDGV
jgi:hypothetical protein